MPSQRLIFHIDVNSAFLSWESVYRLSRDPDAQDLRLIPSAVGGDPSSRHGIVLASSTPAKRYGVTTGEPLVQALRKCPDLVVVPSRFSFYRKCSRAMMDLLSDYTPDSEQFSIDETFLDMTSTIHLFGTPLETADQIRERVKRELGFTVNIGIGPNKLLAKMASDFEKPDKCHTLSAEEIPSRLWPLPIRDLFLVGRSAQHKLENIGIHTIGQLAACDLKILKALCANVCVGFKDWRFCSQSHQADLKEPTDSTAVLYQMACQLLKEAWDLTPVRLISVRAGKIQDDSFCQMSLFSDARSQKQKDMEKAVDAIRERFGTDSIKRASFLKKDALVDHAAGKSKHLDAT